MTFARPSLSTLALWAGTGALACSLVPTEAYAYPRGYRVAILGVGPEADPADPDQTPLFQRDLRDRIMIATRGMAGNHIMPTGRGAVEIYRLDAFDLTNDTPRLNELVGVYDAAIVFTDDTERFDDPSAVGDLLAGLIEDGVGVTVTGGALTSGKGPTGRFVSQGYTPVAYGSAASGASALSAVSYTHLTLPTILRV